MHNKLPIFDERKISLGNLIKCSDEINGNVWESCLVSLRVNGDLQTKIIDEFKDKKYLLGMRVMSRWNRR